MALDIKGRQTVVTMALGEVVASRGEEIERKSGLERFEGEWMDGARFLTYVRYG